MNLTKRHVIHIEFKVFGFLFAFQRPQNSNSGGHKTSIFIDNVPFTLNPWIRLVDTNTNAKEQQICPNVRIQKRAFKLVLCSPEWKKVDVFFCFCPATVFTLPDLKIPKEVNQPPQTIYHILNTYKK